MLKKSEVFRLHETSSNESKYKHFPGMFGSMLHKRMHGIVLT